MALTGAPFTASMRKMGARFPGAEKTSRRRTGVRWALCSAARMSLSRFRRWTRKNCPPGLRYRAEAEENAEEAFEQRRELNALRHKMHKAVEEEDFETAIELRDMIRKMENK